MDIATSSLSLTPCYNAEHYVLGFLLLLLLITRAQWGA